MKYFKDILFSTLMLLIMFSCSSNDAAEVVDGEEEEEEVVVVIDDTEFEATDWTDATHSKNVDPSEVVDSRFTVIEHLTSGKTKKNRG